MNFLKSILLFSLLILCGCSLSAQDSVDEYIDDYKNERGVWAVTIPKWIVQKGFDFSEKFDDEDEEQAYQLLAPYIKEVRILAATENAIKPLKGTIAPLMTTMLKDQSNELYASVRDGNENIHVIVQSIDEIINKISILIESDEEIIAVRIDAELPEDFLKDPRFKFNQ